jgi:hypothetical protein
MPSFAIDRFQAAFVSPTVAQALASDTTTEEFRLNHATSQSFEILRKLIIGDGAYPNKENRMIFADLIEDLGNIELSGLVIEFFETSEELSVSNCVDRVNTRVKFGLRWNRETEFIASHISQLTIAAIREIDLGIASAILELESLRVPSEDWLLEAILELGPLYSGLFGAVRFEYLSPRGIALFFEKISFAELDNCLWCQIQRRLHHPIVYDGNAILWNRFTELIIPSPTSPWSGFISHLMDLCCGNVHREGGVEITCSSTESGNCKSVVDYTRENYWYTRNGSNGWIQLYFKDRAVSVTHYALKSDAMGYHLLQWTLSGSMDGERWTVLGQKNTRDLDGNYQTKVFECDKSSSQRRFYRYIRLTQTGKDSRGSCYQMLAKIELFGSMASAATVELISSGNSPNS